MLYRTLLSALLLTACLGCGQGPQFPDAGIAIDRDAPFPELLPMTTLLASAPADATATLAGNDTLSARLAALRSRAAGLADPVVSGATRARMQAAIGRAALR